VAGCTWVTSRSILINGGKSASDAVIRLPNSSHQHGLEVLSDAAAAQRAGAEPVSLRRREPLPGRVPREPADTAHGWRSTAAWTDACSSSREAAGVRGIPVRRVLFLARGSLIAAEAGIRAGGADEVGRREFRLIPRLSERGEWLLGGID